MDSHRRYCQDNRASKSAPAGVPAITFIGFGNLPTELRLMIWEQFTRVPRVIRTDQVGKRDTKHRESQFAIKINGIVREQVCPLLGVCRESRIVAMKSKLLLFTIGNALKAGSAGDHHFAIRSCDIVFFSCSKMQFQDLSLRGDTDKIVNMMMGEPVHAIRGSIDSSESIWSNWIAFAFEGLRLVERLGNKEHLEKTYGLLHEKKYSDEVKNFDMNDLSEFVPNPPPGCSRYVMGWLEYRHVFSFLMGQKKLMPRLVMRDKELMPWIKSKAVRLAEERSCS
ncbi:hypothetical protein FHL15_009627 [Xylaria flabelliformis]|uniref:2EXR domain-containing protein n=1 Tax=Xylaria flabelliformis TaxID=2512241 RepID=A0A553HND1_9PEZI|nr:hypothetical protein FHL15_009627 [Xylaria flabelliformis]